MMPTTRLRLRSEESDDRVADPSGPGLKPKAATGARGHRADSASVKRTGGGHATAHADRAR
jgi:hypothetical protein